jgi:hypothetical protein
LSSRYLRCPIWPGDARGNNFGRGRFHAGAPRRPSGAAPWTSTRAARSAPSRWVNRASIGVFLSLRPRR